MRRYGIAVATLASLLCFSAAQGSPVVLFNTFGPGDTYGNGGTDFGTIEWHDYDIGNQFRFSGTQPYRLAAVEVATILWSGNNVFDIWLMSDVGGRPGTIIESFRISGGMGQWLIGEPMSYPPIIATSVLQPVLTPDTPYWVVLSAPFGTDAVWIGGIDPRFGLPQAGRTDDGPWWGGSGPGGASGGANAFSITGTLIPTPIPAPAAILLGTLGVGCVSWLRRRKAL